MNTPRGGWQPDYSPAVRPAFTMYQGGRDSQGAIWVEEDGRARVGEAARTANEQITEMHQSNNVPVAPPKIPTGITRMQVWKITAHYKHETLRTHRQNKNRKISTEEIPDSNRESLIYRQDGETRNIGTHEPTQTNGEMPLNSQYAGSPEGFGVFVLHQTRRTYFMKTAKPATGSFRRRRTRGAITDRSDNDTRGTDAELISNKSIPAEESAHRTSIPLSLSTGTAETFDEPLYAQSGGHTDQPPSHVLDLELQGLEVDWVTQVAGTDPTRRHWCWSE